MIKLQVNDQRLLAVPEFKERVDAVVVRCLTTPFDNELLRCVKRRATSEACLLEFEDRDRRKSIPRGSR